MDTDQLRTFLQIVREGNFSKAARSLDLAQPTVSARMRALEQEVGGELLARGGSRVGLTELGESFLPFARRALETLTEGVEAAQASQSGRQGIVRVGTFTSLATTLLPDVLARFHAEFPDVEVRIWDGYHEQVIRELQDGPIELGHVLWPWPLTPPEVVPLAHFREPLVFVVAAGHPYAHHNLTRDELVRGKEPFFHLGSGRLWTLIVSRMRAVGRNNISAPLPTAYELVLRGIGVALFTRRLVEADLKAGRLVELNVEDARPDYRGIALVRHIAKERLSPAGANFARVFQEEAQKAPWLTLAEGEDVFHGLPLTVPTPTSS
jgi:DNA-binding transcriptional LysR family regulator